MPGRLFALLLLGAATVSGCAYFNGLYNANQLIKDARRAEREGRIGEARSLWSRAAVKAESVAVRYDQSKYHDDALVLQGMALWAAGQCRNAAAPLQAAIEISDDPALVERAHFFLGRCEYEDGQMGPAISSFSRTLPSDDTLLASGAHLWRGRAYEATGQHYLAIADFRASSLVDAAFDLAVAYARLDLPADAEDVLRWRVDGDFEPDLWTATLDSVGDFLPDLSATVTELLLERLDLDDAESGDLLLRDGEMWVAWEEGEQAATRFWRVLDVAPGTPAGRMARFRLTVAEVRNTRQLDRMSDWSDTLSTVAEFFGTSRPSISEIAAAVEMASLSLQTPDLDVGAPYDWQMQNPDLEVFLAAEELRDVADAPLIAASLFQELVDRYPQSVVAPKALLAAAALDPTRADSLTTEARRLYPQSPYTMVLRGVALDAYAAIEDSLRTLILARRGAI